MAATPNDDRERVREASPIEEVIGKYVDLVQRGRVWKGLCPFHDDGRPSMDVDPERNTFKCWSCNEGGDVFSFIQKFEKVDFREALTILADRANIELRTQFQDPQIQIQRDKDLEFLDRTATWFTQQLKTAEGRPALEYLKERGFSDSCIRRFRIGYAPPGWNSLESSIRQHVENSEDAIQRAVELGLLKSSAEGKTYDAFRDRIIFPIIRPGKGQYRESGEVIAFGGRHLGHPEAVSQGAANPPKYINSPESRVYSKGNLLYGFQQGQEEIRRRRHVVVCEGYTDVMMAHQHGVSNVVGVLGTALTTKSVQFISRAAQCVDLLFDGDSAGRRAAAKSCEHFLGTDVEVKVVLLEEGTDPCDLLASEGGKDRFQKLLKTGTASLNFLIGEILSLHGFSLGDAQPEVVSKTRRELSERVLMPLSEKGQVLLESGVREVARLTGWSESSILMDFQVDRKAQSERDSSRNRYKRTPSDSPSEFPGGSAHAPHFEQNRAPLGTSSLEDQNASVAVIDESVFNDSRSDLTLEPDIITSELFPNRSVDPAVIAECAMTEAAILKTILRDESCMRPMLRLAPVERWTSALHRELGLLFQNKGKVPELLEIEDPDLKSLLLDLTSRNTRDDEFLDQDQKRNFASRTLAEYLMTALERKKDDFMRTEDKSALVTNINECINMLNNDKFSFSNTSQADEIINRFGLDQY